MVVTTAGAITAPQAPPIDYRLWKRPSPTPEWADGAASEAPVRAATVARAKPTPTPTHADGQPLGPGPAGGDDSAEEDGGRRGDQQAESGDRPGAETVDKAPAGDRQGDDRHRLGQQDAPDAPVAQPEQLVGQQRDQSLDPEERPQCRAPDQTRHHEPAVAEQRRRQERCRGPSGPDPLPSLDRLDHRHGMKQIDPFRPRFLDEIAHQSVVDDHRPPGLCGPGRRERARSGPIRHPSPTAACFASISWVANQHTSARGM